MQKPDFKKFPLSPGVYLFKDYKNKVIYVGRATYLRKRIASYFSKHAETKTTLIINKAKKLNFIKTDNLLDAVILEANLIKKYQPKYNVKEKDDRSFIYIVIPKKEWAFPLVARERQLTKFKPQNAHIFGPFQSYSIVKNLLGMLRKVFPWSTCKLNQGKPCFYRQINLCPGKCVDAIGQKEYQKIIKNLILFLKGGKNKVQKILQKENPAKILFLDKIDDSIFISATKYDNPQIMGRIEGYDISHFAGKETVCAMVVLKNGELDKSQYRLFKIRSAKPNDDLEALKETISRRLKHREWQYPDLILADGGKTQVKAIESILSEHKLNIPVVGIAKYEGDRLIFGKINKPLKTFIPLSFPQLLQIRNEAHRFANSLRKKLLKKPYQ